MEEHEPTGDLKLLLERFRSDGGVVEYVLIDVDLEGETEPVHAIAVWFGMMVVRGRRDRAAARGESYWFNPGALRLVIRDAIPRRAVPETVSSFMQEYHRAFSNPPHPVDDFARPHRPVSTEIDTLFSQINTLIFGEFSMWSIRRWNTEWCSYFDAGRERWGAHLWTFVHENHRHCVWIGASPTD
jgi:hypothetical protein